MVLANVAAAEELERLHQPAMYRVHAPPSDEKLASLRDFLHGLGISLPPGDQVHPRDLDRVLRRVAGTPEAPLVNEVMLRSQSQAEYSPDNIGHFGLALPRYAHFTSPIRRYADLLVHRALIRGLRLGDGALAADEAARFPDTALHITATERRAQLAERDAIDRYLAAYMADKVGANFAARISGVTPFGLFVTVAGSGASGLVPVRSLPDDFWQHDEREQTLTGRRTRLAFRLAQEVEVRLVGSEPGHRGPRVPHPAGRPRPSVAGRARKECESDPGDPRRRHVRSAADCTRACPDLSPLPPGFDPHLITDVYATALAFMAPRTLEPVAVSQLTIWGLRGLAALDPDLTAGLRDGSLRVASAGPRSSRRWRRRRWRRQRLGSRGDGPCPGRGAARPCRCAGPERRALCRASSTNCSTTSIRIPATCRRATPARTASDASVRLVRDCVWSGGAPAIVVAEAIADGPGALAGIRTGDTIASVDGQSTQGQGRCHRDELDRRAGRDRLTLAWRGRDGRLRSARAGTRRGAARDRLRAARPARRW